MCLAAAKLRINFFLDHKACTLTARAAVVRSMSPSEYTKSLYEWNPFYEPHSMNLVIVKRSH